MKSIASKWLALGLCLLLLILTACRNGEGEPTASSGSESAGSASSEPSDPAAPTERVLRLVENGVASVAIVYPQFDPNAKECAATILQSILSITDAEPVFRDDYLMTGHTHDPEAVEILVGNTNYDESVQVLGELGYGDYAIAVVGNKIVVASASVDALEQAAYELTRLLRQGYSAESNSLSISTTVAVSGSVYGENLSEIPKMQLSQGEPVVWNCGNDTYMLYAGGITEDDYNGYLAVLAEAGFENIRSSSKGINRYETYAKGEICLEANYYAGEREIRCIVLPENYYAAYPEYFSPSAVEGSTVPLLTQVGLNYTTVLNGMSYILRTTENTFIIIDGGYDGQGEEQHIYDVLCEQSGGSKPVIAAWILTHPHNDHIGAIADFISRYGDELIPQALIFNFVSETDLIAGDDYAAASYAALNRALSDKWKDCKVIKPHTGQMLWIDGVEMEILHTAEEVFPDTDAMAYNNANTMSFSLKIADRTILITGDLSLPYEQDMVAWYGSGLKCDILQVIHHGRTHGSVDVYRVMNPTIAMWPTSEASDAEYGMKDYNVWLRENVAYNVYCYDGTAVVNLLTMEITQP